MVKKIALYLPIGNVLSRNVALVQAASVLDVMMSMAEDSKDLDRMMYIHEAWVELADKLEFVDDCDDEETEPVKDNGIGFMIPPGKSLIQEKINE